MNASPQTPICAGCGNDGSQGSLYLTLDALWMPELVAWRLVERDDDGGRSFDCLACDHQTSVNGPEALFPYGVDVRTSGYLDNRDQ